MEALAHLVPRDNFYVHFKNIRKFIEFGELLDQWGTNVSRVYELNSRDYQLKERYERQLCLKSTWLGKTLGPAVVRSLALTGSDGYLREGSDLTVLFHVTSKPLFLAAAEPFIQDARRQFAGRLTESRNDYHGITVESFVTPLREVSLYRAALGDFILYANSPTGLRRVLDAHHGRISALADSLDFQYMRTAFPLDDKQEDGFAFFSDAFIRQLVGPASKIKEKRRLEALTSLAMLTHGALFSAWETGRLPADHPALLDASSLKPSDLYTPEGKGVMWDAGQQAAVADVYNTLHFATPLIELPIDKITPAEQQEYNEFRTAYLNLWRQFFDPVGMRFSINDRQVKLETYILPLIRDSRYSTLRSWVSGETAAFDPATISPRTLLHFAVSTSPADLGDWVGDHAVLRLDDDATIGKLVDYWMHRQIAASPANDAEDARGAVRLALQLPLTAGVRIRDRAKFNKFFEDMQSELRNFAPYTATRLKPEYKGIPITRVQFQPGNMIADELRLKRLPNLYHAVIEGWWYVSLREAPLKELIDRAVAKRAGKEVTGTAVPINFSVYAGPKAASEARQALHYYLEWETHRRALVNCPAWFTLYRSGLISPQAPETAKQAAAMRFLTFVPVSPDGATYAYAPEADEVVNQRHGSLRKPRLQPGIEDASPLGRLLEQFRSLRADLRFREDGVHTTVTIERKVDRKASGAFIGYPVKKGP
ncbi:MAG TPA: hypothetical protein VGY66_14740 [Gemmataceae bacterium]|nr:hypothetical protein [Gemmataceae bacterium]